MFTVYVIEKYYRLGFARSVHFNSKRAAEKFIKENESNVGLPTTARYVRGY